MKVGEKKVEIFDLNGFKWKCTIERLRDGFVNSFSFDFFLEDYKKVRPYSYTLELIEQDELTEIYECYIYGCRLKYAHEQYLNKAIEWSEFHNDIVEREFLDNFEEKE